MCQERLATSGAAVLHNFTSEAGKTRLRDEALELLPKAYYCATRHNCFLTANDDALPSEHPRNTLLLNNKGGIADDLIPREAALRSLYDWPPLREFLAQVLGYERLYSMADPLSSLNINVHQIGQVQGWHFDGAPFAITLMLRASRHGGVFEYVPNLRDETSADYEAIGKVLGGERSLIKTLEISDGTLVIFTGHYTLHGVSAPLDRPRVNAILSFATHADARLDAHTQQIFYGRSA